MAVNGPTNDLQWGVLPLSRFAGLSTPAKTLAFIDEDDFTIDDGHFLYSPTIKNWLNIPSWRHQNGTVLNFAEGHCEYWRWKSPEPTTDYFYTYSDLTDPLALQDLARVAQTVPGAN